MDYCLKPECYMGLFLAGSFKHPSTPTFLRPSCNCVCWTEHLASIKVTYPHFLSYEHTPSGNPRHRLMHLSYPSPYMHTYKNGWPLRHIPCNFALMSSHCGTTQPVHSDRILVCRKGKDCDPSILRVHIRTRKNVVGSSSSTQNVSLQASTPTAQLQSIQRTRVEERATGLPGTR